MNEADLYQEIARIIYNEDCQPDSVVFSRIRDVVRSYIQLHTNQEYRTFDTYDDEFSDPTNDDHSGDFDYILFDAMCEDL